MARQIEIADFPIIPHSAAGVDCKDADLFCNECGVVLGVIDSAILSELISLIPTTQG